MLSEQDVALCDAFERIVLVSSGMATVASAGSWAAGAGGEPRACAAVDAAGSAIAPAGSPLCRHDWLWA